MRIRNILVGAGVKVPAPAPGFGYTLDKTKERYSLSLFQH